MIFIFTPKIEEQKEKLISLLVFLNCLLYLYFWQRKCKNGGIEIIETVSPCIVQEVLSLEISKKEEKISMIYKCFQEIIAKGNFYQNLFVIEKGSIICSFSSIIIT